MKHDCRCGPHLETRGHLFCRVLTLSPRGLMFVVVVTVVRA